MQQSDNIYHQEKTPPLAKKSRRRSSRTPGYDVPSQGPARPTQSSIYHDGKKPDPLDNGSRRSARKRRSRRSSRHRSNGNLVGKVLWISLAVIVLVYLGVLAVTQLRTSRRAKPEATEPSGQNAVVSEVTGNESTPVARLEELIKQEKQIARAQELARGLMAENQHEAASRGLLQALEDDPDHIDVKLTLAEVYAGQKLYSKAEDLLFQVLEAQPDRHVARTALAEVMLARKDYEAALAAAKWILETDPYSLKAHDIAATAFLNMDKAGWAVPHLRKIVSLDRENTSAQNKLAVAYSRQGEYGKAVDILEDIIAMDRMESVTYYNLAACYAKQKKTSQAIEVLETASSLFGPSFVGAWLKAEDFDSIRSDSDFADLQKDMVAPATNTPEETAQAGT